MVDFTQEQKDKNKDTKTEEAKAYFWLEERNGHLYIRKTTNQFK